MLLRVSIFFRGKVRADMRDFFRGPRERERGRCSDAVDGFLHTLYMPICTSYIYVGKSKMSQAACYASRLSLDLNALLSFPTAQPEKKNPRQTLPLVRSLVLAVRVDDYLHRPTLPIIYRILFFFSFLVFYFE